MASTFKHLKPEDVRKLRNYELSARLMVEGWLSGRHRSHQRGSSIEFHEYRGYSPGDDPRLVDWRVFARTDRVFLKTFEQETNMEMHLFVDSSASMGFPLADGVTKLDHASFFAACLAWLVVRQTDKVSLHLFDDRIRASFPLGSTRTHLHQCLNALENNKPGNKTSLAAALERSLPVLNRRGTLVILSDFYEDPAAVFKALNPYIHRGFRIHLFQVLTPMELDIGEIGLARFTDLETGEKLTIHSQQVRESYREAVRQRIQTLRTLAVGRRVDWMLARTDESYFALLDRLTQNHG
ncbi:DUF58 domain-containing protein [Prosthecobacter sp.]|uniref:DUF58 domain-containing protein n=1 Tax=Prosthecobacter sp. TaxID=1965333 RepID=UPI003783093C